MRGNARKRTALLSAGVVAALVFGLLPPLGIASGDEGPVVIGAGKVGPRDWVVEAFSERRGICFEVAVFEKEEDSSEGMGSGQCSSPGVHRGILLVAANRKVGHKHPAMMAVGGAFNAAVAAVRVTMFNGRIQRLRPRDVRSGVATGEVGQFRYLAFAVRGPWCAKTVTTLNRKGKALWEARWQEFDSAWRKDASYNPAAICHR